MDTAARPVTVPVVANRRTYANEYWPRPTLYIGRPSIWGNPHVTGQTCPVCRTWHTRDEAVACFEADLRAKMKWTDKWARKILALDNYVLLCWCAPRPCHGDPIITIFKELTHG